MPTLPHESRESEEYEPDAEEDFEVDEDGWHVGPDGVAYNETTGDVAVPLSSLNFSLPRGRADAFTTPRNAPARTDETVFMDAALAEALFPRDQHPQGLALYARIPIISERHFAEDRPIPRVQREIPLTPDSLHAIENAREQLGALLTGIKTPRRKAGRPPGTPGGEVQAVRIHVLLAQRKSWAEIARELKISEKTAQRRLKQYPETFRRISDEY